MKGCLSSFLALCIWSTLLVASLQSLDVNQFVMGWQLLESSQRTSLWDLEFMHMNQHFLRFRIKTRLKWTEICVAKRSRYPKNLNAMARSSCLHDYFVRHPRRRLWYYPLRITYPLMFFMLITTLPWLWRECNYNKKTLNPITILPCW